MIYHDIHIIFWLYFFNVTSILLCLICYSYVISMLVLGYSHGPHEFHTIRPWTSVRTPCRTSAPRGRTMARDAWNGLGLAISGDTPVFEDRKWLHGGLDTWTFFDFPYIGNRNSRLSIYWIWIIIPTVGQHFRTPSFFRGVGGSTTNQIEVLIHWIWGYSKYTIFRQTFAFVCLKSFEIENCMSGLNKRNP